MSLSLADTIRGRRTIGAYRADAPDEQDVLEAIELARWAPNHKKTEPWRVYRLGPQSIQAVVDLNSQMIERKKGPGEAESKRKAWSAIPGWLVITCQRSDDVFRAEEDYAACCCFIQNLMLGLWSKEIGSKWSTGDVTREDAFYRILNIDSQQERVIGLIWYGHPSVVPQQNRKPADQFVVKCP